MGFACEGFAEGALGDGEEKGAQQMKRDHAEKALSHALARLECNYTSTFPSEPGGQAFTSSAIYLGTPRPLGIFS